MLKAGTLIDATLVEAAVAGSPGIPAGARQDLAGQGLMRRHVEGQADALPRRIAILPRDDVRIRDRLVEMVPGDVEAGRFRRAEHSARASAARRSAHSSA
ncbi:hypothetical protein JYK14_04990 [Siccirubricoccus sp. KC 17139]|uniref:Uncharacterized protein n=1 Tax=Siccirubricoccus soli TaxID=2899147 RepID=A0ABT1D1L6_9PROT|nr:hypothetical protein [Siccirubricoccus soli]MCO6415532.1 hypothetical protein [Siccirubricoccus soli]MCP2681664.1 hypothetical protein [Siccirubricoccus soli]